ncbi:putative prolyl 4-hydroxylase subunit alpha [Plasmodium gaboni]|uniref:Putative prolyl 4-hydroxylase subunit alpha n=1 Tax=Plasmodium gaboni TaxID=647221 RepID=A0A151LP41_9APIC|nr:putative prolyl 4-hydroxylase subunit alpha [Plasmodium gaboni]KYO00879.1 putative prolyl 4-hydroxylase subunit alpha [Plasmodium gaboni]
MDVKKTIIKCSSTREFTNVENSKKNEEALKSSKEDFSVNLYDNEIKYSDDMQTIIKKVINEKNIHFYKKYSSYLLYLSNENQMNDSECDDSYTNDENTKVFFKIQLNPQNMSIIYNIVDKKTIEKILSLCANKYKRSKTSIGFSNDKQENYKLTNSINRTSSTVFLYTLRSRSVIEDNQIDAESSIVYTKDENIIELENTICNLVKIPLCYLEPLAIVKYEKNNYFNLHHDGSFRRATLLIYLNDVDKDGETIFPCHNLSIKPIQGSGVFWYNNISVDDEYAITYCINKINQITYEEQNNKYHHILDENNNSSVFLTDSAKVYYPSSYKNQDQKPTTSFHNSFQDGFFLKNNNTTTNNTSINTNEHFNDNTNPNHVLKKKKDLVNFLNDKNNLQKYSIDLVYDELGNTYIADMTMVHQGNRVTEQYKYVINCFFNVNIVRNI